MDEGPAQPHTGKPMPPPREVLVVDDSRIALRFLQVRLEELGYRVQVAGTSEQALAQLALQPVSLAFIDLALGADDAMDGLMLCRQIKQAAGAITPAIVMVAEQTTPSDRVRGSLAGCDAYLTKPLMEEEFLATLRALDPHFASEGSVG